MREKECLAKCFHWKICDFVSGKLSKYLYIHSYTHLITSSALKEWFLVNKFKKRGLLHRVSITDNEYEANMIDNKCHKIYLSGPFGFSVLRHPNHLVLHYLPIPSLGSRRLEVVGERENGRARGRHAPVFPWAHYFQTPATQANRFLARGTQRRNVSTHAWSVSNGFHCALEACLVNLELPQKLFIYLDVLGELWSSRKF